MKILDLFCGCGGLSYGFELEGYQVVAGIDAWDDALNTFKLNHKKSLAIEYDLANPDYESLRERIGSSIDLIIGGPPCQGFSISGHRNPEDPRNKLYVGFVEAVNSFKPKAFLMENVPNLASMKNGEILKTVIGEFTDLGYTVTYKIMLASDYGVPQNRKRLVMIGIKGEKSFVFPEPSTPDQKVTCEDAIGDLSEHSIQDGDKYPTEALTQYQKTMREQSKGLFNHQISEHSAQTKSIISLVPDGGNYKQLPEHLRNTRRVNIAWTRFNSKKPSLTIDTGHRHHFHYKFHRVPTVRESARLQSFPDRFIFTGSKTSQYKQVGNAVPPMLGSVLAKSLKKYLD